MYYWYTSERSRKRGHLVVALYSTLLLLQTHLASNLKSFTKNKKIYNTNKTMQCGGWWRLSEEGGKPLNPQHIQKLWFKGPLLKTNKEVVQI